LTIEWLKTRTTHPRTKTTRTTRTVSRSQPVKNTPPSRASTKSFSETEEDLSAMIPTSSVTVPLKRELQLSRRETH